MTILRIVDPNTREVSLSFEFKARETRTAVVINGAIGSSVFMVNDDEREIYLYVVNSDDFHLITQPVLDRQFEPSVLL